MEFLLYAVQRLSAYRQAHSQRTVMPLADSHLQSAEDHLKSPSAPASHNDSPQTEHREDGSVTLVENNDIEGHQTHLYISTTLQLL